MLGGLIISSFPCSRFSYMLIDLNHFPWGFTWLGGPHPHPHPHPHPYSHSRSHYYPQSHLNSHPNPYIHHTPPHSQFHPYTYSHLYSHSQTLLLPLHSHLFTLISSLSSLQSHLFTLITSISSLSPRQTIRPAGDLFHRPITGQ
jgi:hypothetical protein